MKGVWDEKRRRRTSQASESRTSIRRGSVSLEAGFSPPRPTRSLLLACAHSNAAPACLPPLRRAVVLPLPRPCLVMPASRSVPPVASRQCASVPSIRRWSWQDADAESAGDSHSSRPKCAARPPKHVDEARGAQQASDHARGDARRSTQTHSAAARAAGKLEEIAPSQPLRAICRRKEKDGNEENQLIISRILFTSACLLLCLRCRPGGGLRRKKPICERR